MEVHILYYAGKTGMEIMSVWFLRSDAEAHKARLCKGKPDYDTSRLFVETMHVRGKKPPWVSI